MMPFDPNANTTDPTASSGGFPGAVDQVLLSRGAPSQYGRFQEVQQDQPSQTGDEYKDPSDALDYIYKIAVEDPKRLQQIQQAMYDAGPGAFYGADYYSRHPRTPHFGTVDDDTYLAWKQAVSRSFGYSKAGHPQTPEEVINSSRRDLTAIAEYQRAQRGGLGGAGADIAAQANELRTIAGDYLIPISDATINHWIHSGATKGDFEKYAQDMAKGRFADPNVQQAIDRGITPRHFFEPLVQTVAKELEMSPDSIDLVNDPRFSKLTDVVDAKGARRPMTLNEAQVYARSMPEWQHTQGALDLASKAGDMIANTFGKVA